MQVSRTIHSVGQGGFYTETISDEKGNEFNVVYDCGGKSKSFMKNYIDSCYDNTKPKQRIDYVFISHLHDDHINGLEYLLKVADVQYLILPQLTPDLILNAYIHNLGTSSTSSSSRLVIDLYEGAKEGEFMGVKIKQVLPHTINDDNATITPFREGEFIQVTRYHDSVLNFDNKLEIEPCTIFTIANHWLYIPFNPDIKSTAFFDYLKNELRENPKESIDDFLEKIKKGVIDLGECKKCYRKFFSTHNRYSMLLFSGTFYDVVYSKMRYPYMSRHPFYHSDYFHNILYTGDFEPDFKNGAKSKTVVNQLTDFFYRYWDLIQSIQIPHHGSRENFSDDLYGIGHFCRGFISAGNINKYNHPNKDLMLKVMNRGCFPIVVTESADSIYMESFTIR